MGNHIWRDVEKLSLPESIKMALISIAATIPGFWGSNLFYYFIWKYNLLKHYKIQGDKMPSDKLIQKELKENAIGLFTTLPLSAILFYKLFTLGAKKKLQAQLTLKYLKKVGQDTVGPISDGMAQILVCGLIFGKLD